MALVATDVVATAATVAVNGSLNLTLLIGLVIGAAFLPPMLVARSDLYKQMGPPPRRKPGWFSRPPRAAALYGWLTFINIPLALSMLFYLLYAADPVDDESIQYYVAIESLYYALCAAKYFWLMLVWNQGRHTTAMLLAGALGVLVPVLNAALLVLLGMRQSWVAFGLLWPPLGFYIALPFWTGAIWANYRLRGADVKDARDIV